MCCQYCGRVHSLHIDILFGVDSIDSNVLAQQIVGVIRYV